MLTFVAYSPVKSEIRQMAIHASPLTVCAYVHARALSAPGFAARLALAPDLRRVCGDAAAATQDGVVGRNERFLAVANAPSAHSLSLIHI